MAAADCRVFVILEQVCAKLQNVSALSYMGFKVDFGFGLPGNCTVEHPFVKEEDDNNTSLSDVSGAGLQEGPQHTSVRQDFLAVMTKAAERASLPLPPPLPPRPVSPLRQGFYGPAQPLFRPPCQISGSVWRGLGDIH